MHMHKGPWSFINTLTHTHTHTCLERHKCAFSHTYSHLDSHKQNFGLECQVGFCILQPEEGGYNPGSHIDTQQSSADFSGSCRAQHFPLSTLSSSKSPWQRTCWYPLLCQSQNYKKSCLYFLAVNNFDDSKLNRQTLGLFRSIQFDLLLCLFHHLPWRHCLYHYN